ncbi:mobilization protein [Streptomyces sp. NPDC048196]|uniref:relaxase/mobilization nuclease domain-containing protein n=1 Tax=Streptomyces sp. NPDC048196 TaxID=3154712 RepID=UPI0033C36F4D
MIPDVSRGSRTIGLLHYLYRTSDIEAHIDPHLVAAYDPHLPDPGRDPNATFSELAADLDLWVDALGDKAPKKHVWHCPVRTAPGDRTLTDEEWATVARRVLNATGIAPDGDDQACRWIAVRHAPDHIHIVATLVRADRTRPRHHKDATRAQAECRKIEKEFGLRRLNPGDGTAAKRPSSAERFKAERLGRGITSRERLRTTVRQLVSIATSPEDFLHLLDSVKGVLVDVQHFPSGDIRGYKVAVEGDTNAAGEPVWCSGAKLAPDLSFPKIAERLTAIEAPTATKPTVRRRPSPWHQATAAAERIPHRLDRSDDEVAQAHIAAFGEAIDALPLLAPSHLRPQLQQAATAFERATRSRIYAQQNQARALRGAFRALRTAPVTGDGSGLAMFLDIAVLVVIAAARWHQARQHDQQVAAAHQTLAHLQAAYQQAAAGPLAALAQRTPPVRIMERQAQRVLVIVPDYAQQVLDDPAWPPLAAVLADAETAGHDPEQLLQHAARQRTLDDACSTARTLTWRVQRLAARQAPSDRARAAQARTTATARPAQPGHDTPIHSQHAPGATPARHR